MLFLLPLFFLRQATGCAGGDECEEGECQSVFSPEIIHQPGVQAFFYSNREFYRIHEDIQPIVQHYWQETNSLEWKNHLKSALGDEDLNYLLYEMSLPELDAVIFKLKGKTVDLNEKNKVVFSALKKFSDTPQAIRSLFYLGFAKRVEPIANRRAGQNPWEDENTKFPAPKDEQVKTMLSSAEAALKNVQDPFLVSRYHFQMLRLLFFANQFPETLAFYESHKSSFNDRSSIHYRALQLMAGALFKTKQFAKSNYIFSLIFDQFQPLRQSALLTFKPQNESDWKDSLNLAQSPREKIVLLQMLGIKSDPERAIQDIYALDPKSDFLELLLVRLVNLAEIRHGKLNRLYTEAPSSKSDEKSNAFAEELGTLILPVQKIAAEQKTLKPWLWHLALGHLYALANNAPKAQSALDLCQKTMPKDSLIAEQLRMSILFAKVRGLRKVDPNLEDYFAKELEWLTSSVAKPANDGWVDRKPTLFAWVTFTLGQVYKKKGDALRALMFFRDRGSPVFRDLQQLDQLKTFVISPPKSTLDQWLIKNFGATASSIDHQKIIVLVYADKIAEALKIAEADSKLGKLTLQADPFASRITDCHDCDIAAMASAGKKLTVVDFLKKMNEAKKLTTGNGEAAAAANLLLGNGFYNISYFGNCRNFYADSDNVRDHDELSMNQSLAQKYYDTAVALSKNVEFQAKASFMAVKTENNSSYIGMLLDYDGLETHDFVAGKLFNTYKSRFSKSQYYKEVIGECGFIEKFSPGHAK